MSAELASLDKAFEAGRRAAIDGKETTANPYAYRAEAALYWEWMRGYREYMFPS
jgi:ribosome modulation factor